MPRRGDLHGCRSVAETFLKEAGAERQHRTDPAGGGTRIKRAPPAKDTLESCRNLYSALGHFTENQPLAAFMTG